MILLVCLFFYIQFSLLPLSNHKIDLVYAITFGWNILLEVAGVDSNKVLLRSVKLRKYRGFKECKLELHPVCGISNKNLMEWTVISIYHTVIENDYVESSQNNIIFMGNINLCVSILNRNRVNCCLSGLKSWFTEHSFFLFWGLNPI